MITYVSNFNEARTRIENCEQAMVRTMGLFIVGKARINTPVDTGRLKGSLDSSSEKMGNEIILRIGSNVPYAIYVHEGTRKMRARRYLYNAVIHNIAQLKIIAENTFRGL